MALQVQNMNKKIIGEPVGRAAQQQAFAYLEFMVFREQGRGRRNLGASDDINSSLSP